jgi:hypothetical protein
MPLKAGVRLGHYDILEPLGAGGLAFARGEVARTLRRGPAEAKERRCR